MRSIGRQIEQVVGKVDTRGETAKGQKRQHRGKQHRRIGDAMRKQPWQEHQCVLDPLMQPDRLDPGAYAGLWNCKRAQQRRGAADALGEFAVADNDRAARCSPNRQIGGIAAGVVKAALAEALDQYATLAIGRGAAAIGTCDFIKQPQMNGDLLVQRRIAVSDQHDTSTGGAFLRKPSDQFVAKRQCARVECDALQISQETFMACVGGGQRTAHADTQWHALRVHEADLKRACRAPSSVRIAAPMPITTANHSVATRHSSVAMIDVRSGAPWLTSRLVITASMPPMPPGRKNAALPASTASA